MKEESKSKMKEHKLPSGKLMKYNISSFENGRELYQAVLRECRTLDISTSTELSEKLMIQIGMLALSSKVIENAIWECFDKVVVDGVKLDEAYFEDEENRQDYFAILVEIAKANISPFLRGLYAQFSQIFQSLMKDFQA